MNRKARHGWKNPTAVIDVFEKAFDRGDSSVGLVIKVSHSWRSPNELTRVKEGIRDNPRIYLIDKVLDRREVNGLFSSVDCIVSLHRSEGFGLPLAEAMYLGKAVKGQETIRSSFSPTVAGEKIKHRLQELKLI